MKKFLGKIESISTKVFKQLSGLNEQYFQTALGIEFRKNKIDFMREAGLELFYDNHPLGLHELDFLITPCFDLKEPIIIETNFNYEKINNIFSNVSTLNIFELFDLKKDFEKLGYSSVEIFIHLLELSTTPLMYGILSILSAIIMFGMTKTNSLIVHITAGFLISVMIYYIMFFFTSLGNSGTIPVIWSVLFPILVMSIISTIGLININEK